MSEKERIAEVLKFSGMNTSKFAKAIGVGQTTLAVVINPQKKNKPGLSIIKGIIELYPNINPKWLIIGEGEMWLDQEEAKTLDEQIAQQKKLNKILGMLIKEKDPKLYEEIKEFL